MAHTVCHDVSDWVEENVLQPVEQCVEQDCNWWCLCCNKWFCFIVWIVATVGSWVVHTVCEVVADVVDLVVNVVVGLVKVFVGIFTLNWSLIVDGLLQIGVGLLGFVGDILRIATLGDFIGFVWDTVDRWRLRDYVRGLVEGKYKGDLLDRIKGNLGLGWTDFGLRLRCRALRTFVRSDSRSTPGGLPDLVQIVQNPANNLDLKRIAGFSFSSYWDRFRPDVVADSGSISASDIDAYVRSGGKGPQFSIFCMQQPVLQDKLDKATQKATMLGLKLSWTTEDQEVHRADQVAIQQNQLPAFLADPAIGRHRDPPDAAAAVAELCTPLGVGVFFFQDNSFNGFSAHLRTATCLDGSAFAADGATGAVVRDRMPDWIWIYVLIHELGHTFGLCHVDGLDRIMVSTKDHGSFTWGTIPNYWLHGEPIFTFEEAKKTWDYIVANFAAECLAGGRG
jgi:hypothetical protein